MGKNDGKFPRLCRPAVYGRELIADGLGNYWRIFVLCVNAVRSLRLTQGL
jgi:hypothetical protein